MKPMRLLYNGSFKIEDNTTSNNDITLNGQQNTLRTFWGTKNRAICFDPTDTNLTVTGLTDSGTNGHLLFPVG